MINKDILNKIESFSRFIKHSVVMLKEVRCKQQNQYKMIDTWTDISHIHLYFRSYSDEIMNRPNFTDLPITGCFCEASDIIENLKIRADAATADATNGNYSGYLTEWLNDAINRLSSVSERLEDYIKTAGGTNPSPKEKEPWYKIVHPIIAIIVGLIVIFGFITGIRSCRDLSDKKPSSSPTTQPDTLPVIKSPIDLNIVDINKPISKLPGG